MQGGAQEAMTSALQRREAQERAMRIIWRAERELFREEQHVGLATEWFDPVLGEDVPVADILNHAALYVMGVRSK